MLTNQYGPYGLGYICATMEVNKKKLTFLKQILKTFLIFKLISVTRYYEDGIASNRVSIASR